MMSTFGSTLIEKTSPGSVFYSLSLEGMEQDWQRYTVCVHTLQCSETPKHQGWSLMWCKSNIDVIQD